MTTEAPVQQQDESLTWHALVPRLLSEHGSRRVAEIGVWRGELSAKILAGCPKVRRLMLIDPWEPVYGHDPERGWMVFGPGTTTGEMEQAYAAVVQQFGVLYPRVEILRQSSLEASAIVPNGSLDAVIIDALHTYQACKQDILAWRPKLRSGGLMIGDDLSEWFPGVQRAVEEIFGERYLALGQTWWRIV